MYNKGENNMVGYIYKIYNNVNSKVYIGQTTSTPDSRLSDHISKSKQKQHNSYKLKLETAIREIGSNNFHVETIEKITAENLEDLKAKLSKQEKYWIDFYNSVENGYNKSYGGLGKTFTSKSEEKNIVKMYDEGKRLYEIVNEIGRDVATIRKILRKNKRVIRNNERHVYQYDKYNTLINEYNSATEAAKAIGATTKTDIHTKTSSILEVCNKKKSRKTAYGFIWTFEPLIVNN